MPLDLETLNLDSFNSKPIEYDNLQHWQKLQLLQAAVYNQWKQNKTKKVQIDGEKFKLVKE